MTIFAPTALLADALDDAVFILGPKKGLALVDSFPDCSTVIVDAGNQVWTSKSLEGKLVRSGPADGRHLSSHNDGCGRQRRRNHRRRHHGFGGRVRLAQRGVGVTVVERGIPGAEASSAAAGILGPQMEAEGPGPLLDLGLASRALYPSLAAELREATGIDVGYADRARSRRRATRRASATSASARPGSSGAA